VMISREEEVQELYARQKRHKEKPQRSIMDDDRYRAMWDRLIGARGAVLDETPEQTLLRRTSAAAAMYVIEKEYGNG
jgi:hypothetical protein